MWPMIMPHCLGKRVPQAEPREEDMNGEGTWGQGMRCTEQSRRPTFHRDVLDGEAEDDGPDHAQGHLHVPVHNFYRNSRRVRMGLSRDGVKIPRVPMPLCTPRRESKTTRLHF